MLSATRYHDISCGHRVAGHENKCAHLHGHNYRVTFFCRAKHGLDHLGRVLDFSVIKAKLCMWLEEHWDHRFLAYVEDDAMHCIANAIIDACVPERPGMASVHRMFGDSLVWVPFNPTAENMADYLLCMVGPEQLKGTQVELYRVIVEETRKCAAEASL
jgi:6-pyruvoyltetrahydropterin/6-carboxytetrahydropterin synthase